MVFDNSALCSRNRSFPDSNPDKAYPEWYSILMASWIFFGLAWLALLVNHSIDILERLNSHFKERWNGQKPQGESGDGADNQSEIEKPPITQ